MIYNSLHYLLLSYNVTITTVAIKIEEKLLAWFQLVLSYIYELMFQAISYFKVHNAKINKHTQ